MTTMPKIVEVNLQEVQDYSQGLDVSLATLDQVHLHMEGVEID